MNALYTLPNGDNLRMMRIAAGLQIAESVEQANKIAEKTNSKIRFTARSLRRFENIGINETSYGKTPPTLAELYILLMVYNGTPSYLLLGIKPVVYPIEHDHKRRRGFFNAPMIKIMGDIASWPQERQQLFFDFYKAFIKR